MMMRKLTEVFLAVTLLTVLLTGTAIVFPVPDFRSKRGQATAV